LDNAGDLLLSGRYLVDDIIAIYNICLSQAQAVMLTNTIEFKHFPPP
jgi:hypothetical protein